MEKPIEYKIDKNIPIPDRIRRCGSVLYPFRTMRIGDSFLILCAKSGYKRAQDNMAKAACAFRRNKGSGYFISRFVGKERGLRVWRIK